MSAPWPVIALLGWAAAQSSGGTTSAALDDEGDKPLVEILQSNGALDGPAESAVAVPRWERLRLELRVENRLPAEITDLEVEVALVSSAGAADPAASAIPGWTFRETRADVIPALDDAYLQVIRELPARRTSPPADEIAYRAHIKSYRLSTPELDTALRLLGSSHASDQLAALKSFELAADDRDARVIERAAAIARALARAIEALPADPSPSDALRMLLAVRALGTVGDAAHVHTLLELPDRLDGASWARAVGELATRMVGASDADAP
ncbi:hypothetical protein L6R52_31460, partial [Myxococcota bacterium]|nr:hypothetical protein [Myxococcota bacterium]